MILCRSTMTASSSFTTSTSRSLLADNATSVAVHPMVLLSILDHHSRRQDAEGRVIGTLLGRRDDEGETIKIEVTNCFAVPHAEHGDEVAIGKDFNKQMLQLHQRANRKEVVVGWYATAAAGSTTLIADTSSLIHDFYSTECEEGDPVHIVLDTRLQENSLSVQAYTSTPVTLSADDEEAMAHLFHHIPLTLESTEAESICLNEMRKQQINTNSSVKEDSASLLQESIRRLLGLVDTTLEYVNEVVDGKREPNPNVGRQLAQALSQVPQVPEQVFHEHLQDLLMVTYLSNLTRTQLGIAEKIHASLGV